MKTESTELTNLQNPESNSVNSVKNPERSWLPDMDLNHDKQIQSLLCYRYTIGQEGALDKLKGFTRQSSCQTAVPEGRLRIAHGFNRGSKAQKNREPRRGGRLVAHVFSRPFGTRSHDRVNPRLKPWAIVGRPLGASEEATGPLGTL